MENNEEISKLRDELFDPQINKQRRRYLQDLLYKSSKYDMNSEIIFKNYCETYPWEPECRIYDV